MSRFFDALEQAGRDRALRGGDRSAAAPILEAAPPPVSDQIAPPAASDVLTGPMVAPTMVDEPGALGSDEHLVSLLAPASYEAEQYRALRHLVEQLHRSAGLRVTGISSPSIGDGKTTTAINLAGALAQGTEARVLLVDADLRRPSVMRYLTSDGAERPGLVDAVLRDLSLADIVTRFPEYNLDVVQSGSRPTAPYELLKAQRLGELFETARQRYEHVIVDTSPLVGLPDCKVLGKWIDGFIVVVNAHGTQRKAVGEALTVLDPSKIIGLLFNGEDRRLSNQYYPYSLNGGTARQRRGWGHAVNRVGGALRKRFGLGLRGHTDRA